jgi:hypothetical protein
MNQHQTHALRLLDALTQKVNPKKNKRKIILLGCLENPEGFRSLPEDFCSGWAFRITPHFADPLDIELSRKMRKKQPYHIWTQGSAFYFVPGYTIIWPTMACLCG